MKRFLLFLCVISLFIPLFFLCGCKKTEPLLEYVTELKSDVFTGKSENYSVKATYGYKVEGVKEYRLVFYLVNKPNDQATYSVKFDYGDRTFDKDFSLDKSYKNYVAVLNIENFSLKEFTVSVWCGGEKEDVLLKSLISENVISPSEALKSLREKQPDLIGIYTDSDGNFTGKIVLRVLEKNGKPYYYVGIFDKNNNLKAFLLDGTTGEILAVRKVLQ